VAHSNSRAPKITKQYNTNNNAKNMYKFISWRKKSWTVFCKTIIVILHEEIILTYNFFPLKNLPCTWIFGIIDEIGKVVSKALMDKEIILSTNTVHCEIKWEWKHSRKSKKINLKICETWDLRAGAVIMKKIESKHNLKWIIIVSVLSNIFINEK